MPRLRRAGSPWRILVHEWTGAKGEDGIRYGKAYSVGNDPGAPVRGAETARRLNEIRPDLPQIPTHPERYTVLEGTEFDELVIGKWIHLEQQDTGRWWVNIGGVTVWVTADRDGRPKRVDVFGPGDYAEPEKGCKYVVSWSGDDEP